MSLGLDSRRGAWAEIEGDQGVSTALNQLGEALAGLGEMLEALGSRGKGLDSCLARCTDLGERLDGLLDGDPGSDVRWFETQNQAFRLNRTPLEIADIFRAHLEARPAAWLFTSATLAVGESFDHFAHQLGIEGGERARWDSPFDYPNQALLLLPGGLPEPQAPGFNLAVARLALAVLEASRGRAFLLYTSHRALQEAAAWLKERLPFPLLV
jgi:ATP-dependent DNA helicase DinG